MHEPAFLVSALLITATFAIAQGQPSGNAIPVQVVATASEYVPKTTTISHPGHAYTDCHGSTSYLGDFRGAKKVRGVFEKVPGSGEWWICFWDAQGRKRREKAKGNAILLYRKRKMAALEGKKLPEKLRRAAVSFATIAKDALDDSKIHKASTSYRCDAGRMKYCWRGSASTLPNPLQLRILSASFKAGMGSSYTQPLQGSTFAHL